MDLTSVRAFIFDLDGCVYRGETLVPGVEELLRRLRQRRRQVCFLTNNSREDAAELLAKLERLGVPARQEEILSAAEVTPHYVRERYGPSRVLATGSDTLKRLLREAGHTLVPLVDHPAAEVVVMAHDPDFGYGTLTALARAVARGAAFVAVNLDPQLPVEHGDFYPGCGSLVEAVAAAAGVRPEVVGKPRPHIFQAALRRLGVAAEAAAMIGDSLAADVAGAKPLGLRTIWLAPADALPDATAPDLTIHHFAELRGRI